MKDTVVKASDISVLKEHQAGCYSSPHTRHSGDAKVDTRDIINGLKA